MRVRVPPRASVCAWDRETCCPRAGIGRQASLRDWCRKRRTGSSPVVGTFRGRFWRRALSGRRRSSLRRTNVRLNRTALPSYPYTKITSRKAWIFEGMAWWLESVLWKISLWFFAPVAQLDRVPGYGPGGRGFESLRAYFAGGETRGRVAQLVRALR